VNEQFKGYIEAISRAMDRFAGFCMVAIMAVVVLNILLRVIFNRPLLGTVDYVSLLTAVCIAVGLAHCALQNGQIAIEFVYQKLSPQIQGLIGTVINAAALLFWGAAAWFIVDYARTTAKSGMVASTTPIPLAPFIYMVALGFAALGLVLIIKTAESIRKVLP